MSNVISRIWNEEEGVLSFEWILLVTLLVIGIVGGVAAARDAIIDEFGDVAEAMLALDQTYTVFAPLAVEVHDGQSGDASNSEFTDAIEDFVDCARVGLTGQTASTD